MHQMLVYEGADTSVEAQSGMVYRNELITLTGGFEPPLQDRPPAPAAAESPPTPSHRSIASFFRRDNAFVVLFT
jgi:hypothetical protein